MKQLFGKVYNISTIFMVFGAFLILSCSNNEVEVGDWESFFPKEDVNRYENVVEAPIDKGATAMTKKVYSYLRSNFGTNILSGNPHVELCGVSPKILSYDLMFYTQGCIDSGDKVEDGIPYRITWYEKYQSANEVGGILTLQWHWYAPKDGYAFYYKNASHPNGTTFDVNKAVEKGTEEYNLVIRDIDAISVQLRRLADKNIPVLFRPLHEAAGSDGTDAWFWWGAKGAEPCKKLWDILYDRLTNHHQLHNLLWVWSSPVEGWYPGNDKVDVLGYDSYPAKYDYSTQKTVFNRLYTMCDGKKMIAMTENGPIPDINACFEEDAPWLFFMTWDTFLESHNSSEHVQSMMNNERVIKMPKK